MTLFGIDVSHHNGVSLSLLGSRPGFAIHKATQGISFRDDKFAMRNRSLIGNARVVRGAYHFIESQRLQKYTGGRDDRGSSYSGAKQAEFFIRTVKNANGGTLDGCLMAVDIERLNFRAIKRRSMPEWRDVKSFIDRFRQLTDQPLFIYTTVSWWRRFGNPPLRQWKDVYVWLASWTCMNRIGTGGTNCGQINRSNMPKAGVSPSWWTEGGFGGRKPLIRQWTNNARLGNTRIDGDATPLTVAELRRYANGYTAPGDGGTEPPTGGDPSDDDEPVQDPNPFDEAWLDPDTGEVDPDKVALGAMGGSTVILGALMLLLVVGFVGFTMIRNKGAAGVFDWQKEAQGA